MSDKQTQIGQSILSNKINILVGIAFLIVVLIESRSIGDLDIFLKASQDLTEGRNIYQITYHDWFHYYYDVLFALIISPLKVIPLYWANFIWLSLNLFFLIRIWKISLWYLPLETFSIQKKQILTFIAFTFISAIWLKNMHLTQMTIFILYVCFEGIYRIENKKAIWGSLLLGIGISIKIMPIVLIPYLIYRGYFKATLLTILITLGVVILPGIIIGMDFHWFLLQERWNLINPVKQDLSLDVTERSFHSITTFLSVLLTDTDGNVNSLELKRNIASVNQNTLVIIINIVRLLFILGTLYFIRSWPFKRSKNKLQTYYELSYILLITPLIFPHQQHYSFFLILPAIAYLTFHYYLQFFGPNSVNTNLQKKLAIGVLLVIIYFLLNSHMVLGVYQNIYDHFKTLTYGVLMLIPLLAFASPIKAERLLVEKK